MTEKDRTNGSFQPPTSSRLRSAKRVTGNADDFGQTTASFR